MKDISFIRPPIFLYKFNLTNKFNEPNFIEIYELVTKYCWPAPKSNLV